MQVIKNICKALLAILLVATASSCERRKLTMLDHNSTLVNVTIDWQKFNAPLPGMATLAVIPADASQASLADGNIPGGQVVATRDIVNNRLTLDAGEYYIFAFSGEIAQYADCYDFRFNPDTKLFDISLKPGAEPKPLGVDRVAVTVPEIGYEMDAEGNIIQTGLEIDAPVLRPANVLWTGHVAVKVSGIENVAAAQGEISGFITDSDGNPTGIELGGMEIDGDVITFWFYSLGLPDDWTGEPDDNVISIDFTLTNGETIRTDAPVGDILDVNADDNSVSVEISTVVSKTQGGYDISVDPWQDEQTMK